MALQHSEEEDKTIYKVVVNDEEQYSIWPEYKESPLGWKDVGTTGPKAECLAFIKEVWTDMRPLSLRKKMEEMAKNPPPPPPADKSEEGPSLVDRLCDGVHPLVVSLRPEPTVKGLKAAIDDGYVRLKFTDTKGGTELGIHLDKEATDLGKANFDDGAGKARIIGNLTLDYTRVRCVAEVDLATLDGTGRLEKVAAA